ncbi:MAG TPA: cytochrome c oxidase subunit II [Thermodesulfovibrionales bacterium]|nr:cytochrome c oxidase subunit II [Thermodesulfovibrionales bacterium]
MFIPGASNSARHVDATFAVILAIEVFLLFAVTAAMIFFVIRYRKKKNPRSENVEGGMLLEIAWTAIPTVLVLIMFYIGLKSFILIRKVPEGAMPVQVTARQWSWQFTYANGKQSSTLAVPLNRPVKLILRSQDVLHCLYIPAFRIKEDCVPGLETYLWFTAKETGSYDIFCTEYCGLGHSDMLSKVVVTSAKEFDAWYAGEGEKGGLGLTVLESRGCLGCHSMDGSKKIGPTFKGLYGSQVTVLTSGKERTVTSDEEYLRRSILEPGADIVKGYQNIMPALPVTKEELDAIIQYLKTLK